MLRITIYTLFIFVFSASGDKKNAKICNQPVEGGPCRAYIEQWAYSPENKNCEMFIYGGCGGNDNRFSTYEECMNSCGEKNTKKCNQPVEGRPCRSCRDQRAYSPKSRNCEKFILGGGKNAQICVQPVEKGPCEAYMERWAYCPESKNCHKFIYGGCGGNDNRFLTYEECMNSCKGI